MTIKRGDLVMVVKPLPCCGSAQGTGQIYIAGERYSGVASCDTCGITRVTDAVWVGVGYVKHISRLIKIDPPSQGETREAYKELTV